MLLEDVPSLEYASDVAARVLELLQLPIDMAGVTLAVPASVGVTLAAPGSSVESLLRDADIAMYSAKSQGKGQVAMFDETLRDIASQHLALKIELPEALRSGQFRLDYQPIVDVAHRDDPRLRGADPLAPPGARRCGARASSSQPRRSRGSIVEIGRWVLVQACHQAVEWNTQARPADDERECLRHRSCTTPGSSTSCAARSTIRDCRPHS